MPFATATVIAAAALGIGAASSYASYTNQKAGQKQAKSANALRQRADAIQQNRERRKVVREARVKAAQINSATTASGASQSSSAAGAIGDVQTSGASSVNYLSQVGGLTSQSNQALTKANEYYGASETFGQVANLSFQFAGYAGSEQGGTDIAAAERRVRGVF